MEITPFRGNPPVIAPADRMPRRFPELPAVLVPDAIRPDTIALASIGPASDYADALSRLADIAR